LPQDGVHSTSDALHKLRRPAILVFVRRNVLDALVAMGALWLGVVSLHRGQFWLGVCFIGLAVLRAFMRFKGLKPPKRAPEIRLDIAEPHILRYPKLPPHLEPQLNVVTPSIDGDLKYYPCRVRLNDGTEVDRVYLVSEAPYIKHWGLYPGQDQHKAEILASDVASLTESPSRLPPQFANELYKAGESGMGYTLFVVVFSDNTRQTFGTGNAVDFIEYPEGKGPGDVRAVVAHEGRNDRSRKDAPHYSWCIYSE
jgi:hypothetical protein